MLVYTAKYSFDDSEEEGTRHFMVNVIEPQFNLHSEEANVSTDTRTKYMFLNLCFEEGNVSSDTRTNYTLFNLHSKEANLSSNTRTTYILDNYSFLLEKKKK